MSEETKDTAVNNMHIAVNNMHIWDTSSHPPVTALKPIKGGRMQGMTDINPQWRLKKLTELFGPCGQDWTLTETRRDFVPCGDEIAVFVDISLHINGFPYAIHGTGGSMFRAKESNGLRCNDEAVKMATTDAISVCCKQLGIGSSIYEGAWDGSKYKDEVKPEVKPDLKQQSHDTKPKSEPISKPVALNKADTVIVEPKKTSNFAYLKAMAEQKERLGDVDYYEILDKHGFKHANEILDAKVQRKVWLALDKTAEVVK